MMRAGLARLIFVSLVAGCGGEVAGQEWESETGVVGGRVDRVHVAVGQVGHAERVTSESAEWICSGTLIGERVVLTAAHCLFAETGRRVSARRLRFSVEGEVARGVRSSVARDYAPGAEDRGWDDLAVVELDRDVGVAPIPISRAGPSAGDSAVVVGFGVTRVSREGIASGGGTRRRARITLDLVSDRELAYSAAGGGACYGDSGGPIITGEGELEVVGGVTSRGSEDCSGTNVATRVDAFSRWIDAFSRP